MKSIKHKKLFKAQCLNINCKSKEKICKFAYQNRISTTKWQKKGEQQNEKGLDRENTAAPDLSGRDSGRRRRR